MAEPRTGGEAGREVIEPIVTAADLGRELKLWARRAPGGPVKVAALARRLTISQSSLYAYFAGTTVPSSEALDDLLRALSVPPAEQRRLISAREAVQRPNRVAEREPRPLAHRQVPRELPVEQAGFNGRVSELDTLDRIDAEADGGTASVSVAVISGTAGVGKTALALRWGHRVAGRFPGGCLYADLRGYSPGEPREPGEVLAGFLRGLGLDDAEIPQGGPERAARYRSLLADRRILVVLDNAIDVDQVRPLLPGSGGCFVLVTSRADLTGLRVSPGALPIVLHPLSHNESMAVLRDYLGARVDGKGEETGDLVDRCGGLPLALRIVAARAAIRPEVALSELIAELGSDGLDLFDVGDPETAVRTVFSWSDHHLEPPDAMAFRLLGDHPVRELDVHGVAALLGTDIRTAGRRLSALTTAHLVRGVTPGRFGMHDLVRAYARERAVADLAEADLVAARSRLADYFVDAAAVAISVLQPDAPLRRQGMAETPPMPGVNEARAWLVAEWDSLLGVAELAVQHGWPRTINRLEEVLHGFLSQSGRYGDAVELYGHTLELARQQGDRKAEANALDNLAVAYVGLGRNQEAQQQHQRVLRLYREIGDRHGEASALNNFGNLLERLGRYDEAMDHYRRAARVAGELGLRQGAAILLTNMGFVRTRLGDVAEGLRCGDEALRAFRELGDNGGVARTLGNLGEAWRAAGQLDKAFGFYDRALTIAREIGAQAIETEVLNYLGEAQLASGLVDRSRSSHAAALALAEDTGDRYEQARALEGLGDVCAAEGSPEAASRHRFGALTLYRKLGLPDARRVRALLDIPL